MRSENIIKVIEDLNQDLPEELYENGIIYDYTTNGFVEIIRFADYEICHSDMNTEEEIEEVGGLKQFLVQQKDKFIDMLIKVKS